MITTELENPDRASDGVRILLSININNAHTATKSERTLPLMKNIDATISVSMVMLIGVRKSDNINLLLVFLHNKDNDSVQKNVFGKVFVVI